MTAAARPGRLVLLGHPVAHSVSPIFQNAALRCIGIPVVYEALDTPPDELDARLDALIAERAAGNATIPHKERVAARCTRLTPVAERVGAVNTFRVDDDGLLVGHNTDVAGFDRLARTALGDTPLPRRVALLGAGGAAAAVLAAVEGWPGCEVTLFNRSAERRDRLASRFPVVRSTTGDVARAVKGCEMVVNATPLGLRPSDALPVAIASLERDAVVVDLVYSSDETRWVHAGRAAGHRAADGLEMLLEQGALAFEWWLGVPAPREVMRNAVRGDKESRESRHTRGSGEPGEESREQTAESRNGTPASSHPRGSGDSHHRHPRGSGDPC
ncbi:MAG TPA: shikimate dehydrogenase [Gemmatimonadaceae bacterium]|nr:shikimate dehydrogenase [Gemmatimonadaceae bacterium]